MECGAEALSPWLNQEVARLSAATILLVDTVLADVAANAGCIGMSLSCHHKCNVCLHLEEDCELACITCRVVPFAGGVADAEAVPGRTLCHPLQIWQHCELHSTVMCNAGKRVVQLGSGGLHSWAVESGDKLLNECCWYYGTNLCCHLAGIVPPESP